MPLLTDTEEQQAQRIACTHLVGGCEGAVSELRATGDLEGPSPAMERAQDILAEVLFSWRDALKVLEEPRDVTIAASSLDGWTGDELFAEAIHRTADDGPALQLMQGVLLRAVLGAHDRAVAGDGGGR